MDILISKGQGISQAIKGQLKRLGAKEEAFNGSVWNQILDLVDEQNENGEKLYEGGKNRSGNWKNNYKVIPGQILKISDDIWKKIKNLVNIFDNGKVDEQAKQRDMEAAKVNIDDSKPKLKEHFEKANEVLAKAANITPKPYIENYDEKSKIATLPDGTWIAVEYDENNEIVSVCISYDTTMKKQADGTFDEAEVRYYPDKAKYMLPEDLQRDLFIDSGSYNFENIKAIAQKIFG